MFLSRLTLHQSAISLQDFAELGFGPQATHRLIWKAFGDDPSRDRDFIYRADLERDRWVLWAVSAREPDDWGSRFITETKVYDPALREGQRLGFKMRVNATVSSFVEGKRGRRHDAVMHFKKHLSADERAGYTQAEMVHEAGLSWLQRRGERAGFEVSPGGVVADSYRQHRFHKKKSSRRQVLFSTIDFAGVMTVRDPEALRQTLFHGIGAAKAYGNGLILVRPV